MSRISYGCTVLAVLFVVVALVTRTPWVAWTGMGLALIGTVIFAIDYWQLHRKPRHRRKD